MCRSIKVLRRPGEPATEDELRGAALQFVRKISGFHKPSRANEAAFERAVFEISKSSERLLREIAANSGPQHQDKPLPVSLP
jgi:hypothetical protein